MSNWKRGLGDKTDFTSEHLYTYYNKTHTNTLNKKDYMRVIKEMNKRIIDSIFKGSVIHLTGIGMIGIKNSLPKMVFDEDGKLDINKSSLSTDWGETNKLWDSRPELKHKKFIFHENFHTEGKRFKITWNRLYVTVPCMQYYRFLATRAFKRNLAKYIKNNPNQEYYEF